MRPMEIRSHFLYLDCLNGLAGQCLSLRPVHRGCGPLLVFTTPRLGSRLIKTDLVLLSADLLSSFMNNLNATVVTFPEDYHTRLRTIGDGKLDLFLSSRARSARSNAHGRWISMNFNVLSVHKTLSFILLKKLKTSLLNMPIHLAFPNFLRPNCGLITRFSAKHNYPPQWALYFYAPYDSLNRLCQECWENGALPDYLISFLWHPWCTGAVEKACLITIMARYTEVGVRCRQPWPWILEYHRTT